MRVYASFICFYLTRAYAKFATLAFTWARSSSHRRCDLLAQALHGLRLKSDRFKGSGGGADQFRVRVGAGAVGQAEIVLKPDPRMTTKQRGGGDAGGLAAAEGADAPRVEPGHVGGDERQEVAGRGGAGNRIPPEHIEDGELLEGDQPLFHHRPQALHLGGRIEDDLRPDAHLLQLAEE